jgi:hypothetical protein
MNTLLLPAQFFTPIALVTRAIGEALSGGKSVEVTDQAGLGLLVD